MSPKSVLQTPADHGPSNQGAARWSRIIASCLVAASLALSFSDATATSLSITPNAPTTATPVTISVTSTCPTHGVISQSGFLFDIQSNYNCITLPQVTNDYPVGLLPPGIYTVREVDVDDPSSIQVLGSFTVVAAANADGIPAMDGRGMTALIVVLMVAALAMLPRLDGS